MSERALGAVPRRLAANGRRDPIGVSTPAPVLSWKLDGDIVPTEYIIRASESKLDLAKSGERFELRIPGANETRVDWPGPPLASRERLWWSVCAVYGDQEVWSEGASLEAPLWDDGEWDAVAVTHPQWISPGSNAPIAFPVIATTIEVARPLLSARLYFTGSGIVVPTINGSPAIVGQLEPGYSVLDKGTPATAWDVTQHLSVGLNSIEFGIGGGITYVPALPQRYTKYDDTSRPLWVRGRLEIQLDNGDIIAVGTGPGWQSRLGRTRVSHWYGGQDDGSRPASEWVGAEVVPDVPAPWWRSAPPIVVVERLAPTTMRTLDGGSRVLDFGINVAGRPAVDTAGSTSTVTLTPSELLTADGLPDQATTGWPIYDSVDAVDDEIWRPSTVYHGGRYLHVDGLPPESASGSVMFEVLRTDNDRVGSFTSSDTFLNRLHEIIDRAVQGNMHSVFTDCPHREKLGWVEQLHYCFEVIARNYDVSAHLTDMVRHMVESQTASGLIPSIAPEQVVFNTFPWKGDIDAFRDDVNWGRTIIALPLRLFRHYGDTAALVTAYPAMLKYLEHVESRSIDDTLDYGLGDWIEIDTTTPRSLAATHGWALALDEAAEVAELLGDHAVATKLSDRAEEIWDVFHREHFDRETRIWGSGSQGSWAFAYSSPRLTDDEREGVVLGLREAITRARGTITVGENSLPFMIRALTESGNAELVNSMIRRTDSPGYGHQIASGVTALTESWGGPYADHGVGSQNHFMLGVIDEWLIADVAGLRQSVGSTGWGKVTIRPTALHGVDHVTTRFDSPRGLFIAGWRRAADDGVLEVFASLPAGVTADFILPEGARQILTPSESL